MCMVLFVCSKHYHSYNKHHCITTVGYVRIDRCSIGQVKVCTRDRLPTEQVRTVCSQFVPNTITAVIKIK